jgi:hypothetical protein
LSVEGLKHLHSRRNHGEGGDQETDCHTLDGGEGDTQLAETRVQKVINERNHDDDRDGVQVLNDIVGNTVENHGGGLSGEVTGHLVISQMENRQVKEDLAGHQTTTDLIDPGIVVGHPSRALINRNLRGLGMLPVEAEERAALTDVEEHAQELGEDGTSGWLELVLLLVEGEDDGGDEEEDGGDEEGEPEGVILLNVDHGDLTADGTDVDGEVEVEEDTSVGHGRIDNDTLAVADLDAHLCVLVLISKERRDVGLEEASPDAENNETDDEGTKSGILADDDRGRRSGDEDNMSACRDGDGDVKSEETTELGICNPGT